MCVMLNNDDCLFIIEYEVDTLKISEVLEKYDDKKRTLRRLFDLLVVAWAEVKDAITLGECQHDGGGGIVLQDLTENSNISMLIKEPAEFGGELRRVIVTGFAKIQSDFIAGREKLSASAYNPLGLGYNNDAANENLALLSLTGNSDNISHLITGEDYTGEILMFICSQMTIDKDLSVKSIRYNHANIVRHLLWRYTTEAMGIDTEWKLEFKPLAEKELEGDDSELFMEAFNTMRSVNALRRYITVLDRFIDGKGSRMNADVAELKKRTISFLNEPVANPQKLEKIVRQYGEPALIQAASYLERAARYAIERSTEEASIKSLAKRTIGHFYVRGAIDENNEGNEEGEERFGKRIAANLEPLTDYPCSNLM